MVGVLEGGGGGRDRSGESSKMAHPTHNFCRKIGMLSSPYEFFLGVLTLTVKDSVRQASISNIQISCFLL